MYRYMYGRKGNREYHNNMANKYYQNPGTKIDFKKGTSLSSDFKSPQVEINPIFNPYKITCEINEIAETGLGRNVRAIVKLYCAVNSHTIGCRYWVILALIE